MNDHAVIRESQFQKYSAALLVDNGWEVMVPEERLGNLNLGVMLQAIEVSTGDESTDPNQVVQWIQFEEFQLNGESHEVEFKPFTSTDLYLIAS